MTDPRDLNIEDFSYDLPDDRIARFPLPERDAAKLLHFLDGQIEDYHFQDLPALLPPGTFLVGNATRVIHARMFFTTSNDKTIEVFCLDPVDPIDYQRNFASTTSVTWKCLIGGNRKWKSGMATLTVEINNTAVTLSAARGDRMENAFAVQFSWSDENFSFGQLLDAAGNIPLPPYLGRDAVAEDQDRYQTVFAQTEGSVAAPTAGLHLSERLMNKLRQQNLNWGEVILHVGAGTFKPVSSPTMAGHEMHAEYFEVDLQFLARLQAQLASGQPIVSVGTTSTRCLESLYYLGVALLSGAPLNLKEVVQIGQWAAADLKSNRYSPENAIEALLSATKSAGRTIVQGSTSLMITPGIQLRVIDGMITNFHQPNSTLLLLVAALTGGNHWRDIYAHALAGTYRFLSYGDGSLLWRSR